MKRILVALCLLITAATVYGDPPNISGTGGGSLAVLSESADRQVYQVHVTTSSTNPTVGGADGLSVTVGGTRSNVVSATDRRVWQNISTSTVLGNGGFWDLPSGVPSIAADPDVTFVIKTAADITNVRIIMLIGQGQMWNNTAESASGWKGSLIHYDTGVHGTAFWRVMTRSSVGDWVETTTTVPVTADTVYTMRIKCTASAHEFYKGDALMATHTGAVVPSTWAGTGDRAGVSITTLVAASKTLSVGGIYIVQ